MIDIKAEERKIKTAKRIREGKTIAGFTVAYFLFFWFSDGNPADFRDFVTMVFVSVFLAVIHFGVNDAIFDHLHTKENVEQEWLDSIKKQDDKNSTH